MSPPSYNPREFKALTYHDATSSFGEGTDSPRAYLERCLETIAEKEPSIMAFPAMNEAGAREAADASTERWQAGRPLSPIDGIPIGIKDLLETKDMPTQMGCDACTGNFPKRDNAAVWALREAGAVVSAKRSPQNLVAPIRGRHGIHSISPAHRAARRRVPRRRSRRACCRPPLGHKSVARSFAPPLIAGTLPLNRVRVALIVANVRPPV